MSTTICFSGVSSVTVDTKGRVSIPSRYRQELHKLCESILVVTASIHTRSILIYPRPNWELVEKRLQKLSSNGTGIYMQRMMLGHATECEPDSNGRILLPSALPKDMRIKKSCVLLGIDNRFELWGREVWDKYREQKMEQMMEQMEREGSDSVLKEFSL